MFATSGLAARCIVTSVTVTALPPWFFHVIASGVAANEWETDMKTDNRELNANELTANELDAVNGGMKWTAGTANPDVIDARGGQLNFLGLHMTFGIKGNVTSIGWG
jgi:hypothetical protein